MRQLKFRAWDKKNKAIRNVWGLNWSFSGDKLQSIIAVDPVINGDYILKNDDFELMQFINELDQDGKEIYEGDVIEITSVPSVSPPDLVGRRYKIIWDNIDGKWQGWALVNKNYKEKYKDSISYQWYAGGKGCKVIGNIYENPELLK